jgi:hypothetical protein
MFIKEVIGEGNSNIDDMLVDVIISDGEYECIAMYDFPELKQGDTLNKPLYALSNNNVQISTKEIGFYKLKNYYAYNIVGVLHKKYKNIVSVGNILIEIDNSIPQDIKTDTIIKFYCDRLDV